MSVDFAWMSKGGVLLDSTGDIAFTQSPWECMQAMVSTRLKAAIDGWKLYRIGADLDALIGQTVAPELETAIQRQVQASLSNDFLPVGFFQVKTVALGQSVKVFVYIQSTLIASTTVNT